MSAHGMSEAGGLREGRCSGCGTPLREVGGLMTCDHARCPGNLIARGLVTEPDSASEPLSALLTEHELLSGNTATRRKRRFVGSFVCRCGHYEHEVEDVGYQTLHARHVAAALLASDWLAAREAKARAETGEQALREAADALDEESEQIGGMYYAGDCTERLRDRADRIARDVTR